MLVHTTPVLPSCFPLSLLLTLLSLTLKVFMSLCETRFQPFY